MFRYAALSAVFCLIVFPAAMSAGGKQSLPTGQQAGVISAILRNATLSRTSLSDAPADHGTSVAWNDRLRTDGNGRVHVKLADDSSLSMGANSEVVFTGQQNQTTSLALNYGQMRLSTSANDKFEVRTPDAMITGTGSDFAIDASVPGRVRIICLEGTVQVASPHSGATSECDAGEIVIVKAGKAPHQPQLADATTLGIARNVTDPEERSPVQYFP